MIDFLKYRYIGYWLSLALFIVGAGVFWHNKTTTGSGFLYEIDFVGGTELTVAFDRPINIEQVRAAVAEKGYTPQSIGVSEQGGHREFLMRTATTLEQDLGLDKEMHALLTTAIPDNPAKILSISSVGAQVGRDIMWNSILAVLLSLLFILLYIGIRSELRFALGAVAALGHDMLWMLVCLLIFREQFSLNVLAAILAILGYSLNDTIVIFSRIRENMKKLRNMPEFDIVNLSINQTLRRTLLTSFSTLLAVLAIFFLGGEALHGFAFTMMVGIIAGTYSSIYIASPVVLAYGSSKKQ